MLKNRSDVSRVPRKSPKSCLVFRASSIQQKNILSIERTGDWTVQRMDGFIENIHGRSTHAHTQTQNKAIYNRGPRSETSLRCGSFPPHTHKHNARFGQGERGPQASPSPGNPLSLPPKPDPFSPTPPHRLMWPSPPYRCPSGIRKAPGVDGSKT